METRITGVAAVKRFFESEPYSRKVELSEFKDLKTSPKDWRELVAMCEAEVNQ